MSYDNRKLIYDIKQKGYLKSPELEKALLELPREKFVPENARRFAYDDIPLSISQRQTISQPSTVVIMTEALEVKPTDKILEIGTGSGWQAAILSKLTKKNVYSIERIPQLVKSAKDLLKILLIKNVNVIEGDGSNGLKKYAPYDKIIVTAASPEIPAPLIEQLKPGGKLVIPVGDYDVQDLILVEKTSKTKMIKRNLGKFRFVALIGRYGFQRKD